MGEGKTLQINNCTSLFSEYYPWANVVRDTNIMHENADGQNIQIETSAAITSSNQLGVYFLHANNGWPGGFSYDGSKYRIWKQR